MKVPLGEVPLIKTPFNRIAIDLVRPISPVSESRFLYLTNHRRLCYSVP